MKFIFPKNYKYNAKILGFIDYTTAVVDLIIGVILFFIVNLIFTSLSTKIYVFISLFFPVILFSIIGTNGENIILYLISIIKFMKNRKVYFYIKEGTLEIKINNKRRNIISMMKSKIEKIK